MLESATTVWSIGMANGNGGDVRTWEYIASGAAIVCHGSSFEADRHRMPRMVAFRYRHMANKKAKRVGQR